MPRALLAAVLTLSLAACAQTGPVVSNDPLIEQIVAADGQRLTPTALMQRIAGYEVVLLGEKHDNARHHAIQAEILGQWLADGRRPALGFEFFTVEQSPLLNAYSEAGPNPASAEQESRLRQQLGWQQRDDDWAYYLPLLRLARSQQLTVVGLDLPTPLQRHMTRKGAAGLDAVSRALLPAALPEDPGYRAWMLDQLSAAHCGWRDDAVLGRLFEVWQMRNARMADSIARLLEQEPGRPVLVIVGSGHLQYDRGLVEALQQRRPGVRLFNLGLREVARQTLPLADYLASVRIGERPEQKEHHALWLTGRATYDDPCETYRDSLRQHSSTPPASG